MSFDKKKYQVYIDNYIGNLGTKILIEEKRSLLEKRFSPSYLDKVLSDINISIKNEGDDMSSFFIYDSIDIDKGGVLTALWRLCDKNKLGLKYSLKDIPILQGTVEICNFFDLNPYRLLSHNGKLLLIDKKNESDEIVFRNLILIGETNNEKKRVRIDGEVEAFLTKDYKDEIDKVLKNYTKNI